MLQSVRKWFAIRRYGKGLGRALRERYGAALSYSPGQVKKTIEVGGFSAAYVCCAVAMYCDYSAFVEYQQMTGELCDYSAMRAKIGNRLATDGRSDGSGSSWSDGSPGTDTSNWQGGGD